MRSTPEDTARTVSTPIDYERVEQNLIAHTQDAIDFYGPGRDTAPAGPPP